MADSRSEIAFFDVETTVPMKPGQGYALLEFGAILVCPRKLIEVGSYSSLIRPYDLELISAKSQRCNGISRDSVASVPCFADLADQIFDVLDGRIWAGHNILRFDCARIREAFAEIGRPPPEPKGYIDSLVLLTERFGRRAGNMKMATLANYFGLGQQTHRSLDDVRMNLEVVKYCATVLFLESSLPDILANNAWNSPTSAQRIHSGGKDVFMETTNTPDSASHLRNHTNQTPDAKTHNHVEPSKPNAAAFNMSVLKEEIMSDAMYEDNPMNEQPLNGSPECSPPSVTTEGSTSYSQFLTPDDVSVPHISAFLVPYSRGNRRIQILHNDVALKLFCSNLKVRFGISTKFVDQAGRPRLSFVVDAPLSLCQVLEACDGHAQRTFVQMGSLSDWRPIVYRKNGYVSFPTLRIQIPTVITGDTAKYGTEIFQKETTSGAEQKLMFSKFDPTELETLFSPGTFIDAFITLDPYDYQQNAGIRLIAEKLVIHSK